MGQRLSASRLGLARECLWSFTGAVELPAEQANRYTDAGHELASWQARLVNGDVDPGAAGTPERVLAWWVSWSDLRPEDARAEVAMAYDPRTGRARVLGVNLGRRYAEAGLLDHEIPGTADVAGRDGEVAVITDTKGGPGEQWIQRVEAASANWQLGLLALMWTRVLGVFRARVEIHHVDESGRIRYRDIASLDALDLARIEDDVQGIWAKLGKGKIKPRAGTHCVDQYCPALQGCAAAQSEAAKLIPIDRLSQAIERDPGGAVIQYELASKLMDRWHNGLKQYADAKGSIRIDDQWEWAGSDVTVKPESKPRGGYTKRVYRRRRVA